MELEHISWVAHMSWGLVRTQRRDKDECFAIKIGQTEQLLPFLGKKAEVEPCWMLTRPM